MQTRKGWSLCDVEEASLRDCKVWYDWSKRQVTRLWEDWAYFVVSDCRFSKAVQSFLAAILHGRQALTEDIRSYYPADADDILSMMQPFPWLGSRPYGKWR
jgi:hypothetical protein